ncbi:IPExxxVDY family protein [Echinicola strongylocentroti]|uniref:IPExxxVDY family protein n=1 Tax=Echinicola strongylocentroti TaxID=1795355 RepID=A0A2Z4IMA4_9BACT|nr:IPExxxVDY family protein [Echinicola strongylocentroti]AWW31726.1 IPExxxVDY family protein [Echinicola strongylocentroti]
MRKTKLQVEHDFNFDLLGLVAPVKDYKMAWVVNSLLGIRMIKIDDFKLEFLNQPKLEISRYILEKDHGYIQLLKNRSFSDSGQTLYLVPELKIMDYFLLLQDFTQETSLNQCIGQLSHSNYVQNIVKLDVEKLKSKENLLTY